MPTRKWEKEREVAQVDRTQIRKTLTICNSRETARVGSLGILVGSKSTVVAVAGNNVIPPAPKANTKETVQEMFDTGYFKYPETAFWDGKNIKNVVKGTHFLWKNVAMGKNGGESTKTEVFHGECHGWENDFVIVS